MISKVLQLSSLTLVLTVLCGMAAPFAQAQISVHSDLEELRRCQLGQRKSVRQMIKKLELASAHAYRDAERADDQAQEKVLLKSGNEYTALQNELLDLQTKFSSNDKRINDYLVKMTDQSGYQDHAQMIKIVQNIPVLDSALDEQENKAVKIRVQNVRFAKTCELYGRTLISNDE